MFDLGFPFGFLSFQRDDDYADGDVWLAVDPGTSNLPHFYQAVHIILPDMVKFEYSRADGMSDDISPMTRFISTPNLYQADLWPRL